MVPDRLTKPRKIPTRKKQNTTLFREQVRGVAGGAGGGDGDRGPRRLVGYAYACCCTLRPRTTPPPEGKSILGVICGVLLWADMNAATPPGSRGRSALCAGEPLSGEPVRRRPITLYYPKLPCKKGYPNTDGVNNVLSANRFAAKRFRYGANNTFPDHDMLPLGSRPDPFNSTSMGVNSVSPAHLRVRPMPRTCR